MPKPLTAAETATLAFCAALTLDPRITYTGARVGTWILGAAMVTGQYPIELTVREIARGITLENGKTVGSGGHAHTIREGLRQLEEAGYLIKEPARVRPGGFLSYYYHFKV